MNNIKQEKKPKDTPSNMAKKFVRNSGYLMSSKYFVEMGPKYVFLSPRVPQVKVY